MARLKTIANIGLTWDEVKVRASVNRILLSQIGSQFAAGEPDLDVEAEQWQVPILMITPGLVVGQVGLAIVDQQTCEIVSHTPAEQIYEAAGELRKLHHAEIKAAFLQARRR